MKKIWGHAGNHRVNFLSVCTPRLFDMKIRVLTVLQDPHSNLILLGKGIEGGKCCFPDHILLSTSLFCCCSFPLLLANGWCLVEITPSPRNGCLLRGPSSSKRQHWFDYRWRGPSPLPFLMAHLQSSYGLTSMELAMRDPLSMACFMIL